MEKRVSRDQQDGPVAQCQCERVSGEAFVHLIHMFLRFIKQKHLDFCYHIKPHTVNSSPQVFPFCIAPFILIFSFQTVSLCISGGDFHFPPSVGHIIGGDIMSKSFNQ